MMDTERKSFSLDDVKQMSTITTNVEQEYIITTYDKVRLVLREYEDDKKLAQNWWNYLGMTLSFGLPCFTSEFQDFLGLSANILEAFFVIIYTSIRKTKLKFTSCL